MMHFGRAGGASPGVFLWPLLVLSVLLALLTDPCSALISKQKQSSDNRTATTETDGRQPEVGAGSAKKSEPMNGSGATSTSNKSRQQEWSSSSSAPPPPPPPVDSSGSDKRKPKARRLGECEYERGPWEECQPNGTQRRTLRLRDGASRRGQRAPDPPCEPIKTIERECKLVGCKYARGEWSNSCVDGRRSRVDTLLATLGPPEARGGDRNSRCPAQRTVTKECRRTCHYIKSAWSDCIDGFKTRKLTLEPSVAPDSTNGGKQGDGGDGGSRCLKERPIRRPCRLRDFPSNSKQAPPQGGLPTASARQLPGFRVKSSAQRRRLQKQQKLQQQQKAPSTGNNSTTGGPQERESNGLKQRNRN